MKELEKDVCIKAFDEIAEVLLNNGYSQLPVTILKREYEKLRDFYDAHGGETDD